MKLIRLKINPQDDSFLSRYERSKAYMHRLQILDSGKVHYLEVRNGRGYQYLVLLSEKATRGYCSCPDFAKNKPKPCKHILAAMTFINRRNAEEANSFGIRDEDGNPVPDKLIADAMAEQREAEILRDEVYDQNVRP